MRAALALLPTLLPALLAAAPAHAQRQRELPYRAAGYEPRWTLTIGGGLMRYVGDNGRTRIVTAEPEARPSFNGRRYVTPRLTVDVTRAPCTDAATGAIFPERVMVTTARRTVRGCGGTPDAAPARIPAIDGNWRIETVEGRELRGGRPATVRFALNRISGNGGCNAFGGSYSYVRGTLTAGPLISTKMACPGPGMDEEQAIMELLGRPLTARAMPGGKLVLSAGGMHTLLLVPAGPDLG